MKNEAEVCSIITRSYKDFVKIPDPSGNYTHTSIRCFDGIGMLPEKLILKNKSDENCFICWEAKHLKGMQAFNFTRVEPHQDYYLSKYASCQNVYSFLLIGISVKRADNRIYVIDYKDCGHELYQAKFSIHRKFLEKLAYNKISRGTFKFENIIQWKDLEQVYENENLRFEVNSQFSCNSDLQV